MNVYRRAHCWLVAALLLGLSCLAPTPTAAQPLQIGIDAQRFHPALDPLGGWLTEGATAPPRWATHAAVSVSYGRRPLSFFFQNDEVVEVLPHLLGMEYAFGVGLGWGGVVLSLPMQLVPGVAPIPGQDDAVAPAALGDLRLAARVRLLAPDGSLPALAAMLELGLPTGAPARLSGDPGLELAPRVMLEGRSGRLRVLANIGGRLRIGMPVRDPSQPALLPDNEVLGTVGVEAALGPRVHLRGELSASLLLGPERATAFVGEWMIGPEFTLPRGLRLGATVGTGIGGQAGSPLFRSQVTLRWSDPRRGGQDIDGDGLADVRDRCPRQPEDWDGHADLDGCPDPDNDGDRIPDARDECPADREDANGLRDDDGCPDGVRDGDGDGDGWADTEDDCPDRPEHFNGFQDDDGCPDQVPRSLRGVLLPPDDITFLPGRSRLSPRAMSQLARFAADLRAQPWLTVQVEAVVAPGQVSLGLAQRRLQEVTDLLRTLGIPRARMRTSERQLTARFGVGGPALSRTAHRIGFVILGEG